MISTLTLQGLVIGQGTSYSILDAKGFESPDVDISKHVLAGRHGAVIVRSLWRDRKIRLEIGIRAATAVAYATLRQNLIKALDVPTNGSTLPLYITTTDGKSLQMNVNISNPIDGGFDAGLLTVGKVRVEMISPDLCIVDQSLDEETVTPPIAGGITLPTAIPFSLTTSGGSASVVNSGNGIVFPTIRITGPCTNATINNTTLGKSFQIQTTIDAGDYVDIDLENQTVLLNGVTNYLTYFTGDWLWLKAGSNTIHFSASDNNPLASARIQWRNAYLGI